MHCPMLEGELLTLDPQPSRRLRLCANAPLTVQHLQIEARNNTGVVVVLGVFLVVRRKSSS